MQENTGTSLTIAALPPAERAVIALESTKTEAQLRELVTYSAGITSVTDKDSREQAHRAGMNLKNARVAINKTGKAAREDAQAFCTAVIAEEKRLVGIIQGEEDRVFALRDGYDAEQARIKAEAEAQEKARVANIRAKIDGVRNLPAASFRDSAEDLAATIADLEAYAITEADFAEFAGEAADAKGNALVDLRALHEKAVAAEAEAARLAAEQERLRAEREALEAERRAFEQKVAAEQARYATEQSARQFAAEVGQAGLVSVDVPDGDNLVPAAAEEIDVPEFVEAPANDDAPVIIGMDLAAGADKTVYFYEALPVDEAAQQAEAVFRDAVAMLLRHHSTEQARVIFDEELQRFLAAA